MRPSVIGLGLAVCANTALAGPMFGMSCASGCSAAYWFCMGHGGAAAAITFGGAGPLAVVGCGAGYAICMTTVCGAATIAPTP
jgi:hypothetical protein